MTGLRESVLNGPTGLVGLSKADVGVSTPGLGDEADLVWPLFVASCLSASLGGNPTKRLEKSPDIAAAMAELEFSRGFLFSVWDGVPALEGMEAMSN